MVSGPERKIFLQGVISADVSSLKEGEGCWAALLEPKGKYVAPLEVFDTSSGILITAPVELVDTLVRSFTRFRFRAKITIDNISAHYTVLSLQGPKSDLIAGQAGVELPPANDLSIRKSRDESHVKWAVRMSDTDQPGMWLLTHANTVNPLLATLIDAGAVECGLDVLDVFRIEAGLPAWGRDIDETVIPLEAGQERALSFNKCYPGQEVLSRIHFRGHVNRLLQILELKCPGMPPVGAAIHALGRDVGQLTSVVCVPESGRIKALGYVRRDVLLEGAELSVEWDGGACPCTAIQLPYSTMA